MAYLVVDHSLGSQVKESDGSKYLLQRFWYSSQVIGI